MVTADTPLGAGSRITGEARETLAGQLSRRYQAGESIRAIAADLGRSYGFVQTLLREAGVILRTRGGDTRSSVARERQATVAQRTTSTTVPAVEDPEKVQSLEIQQMVAEPVAEVPDEAVRVSDAENPATEDNKDNKDGNGKKDKDKKDKDKKKDKSKKSPDPDKYPKDSKSSKNSKDEPEPAALEKSEKSRKKSGKSKDKDKASKKKNK